MENGKIAPGGGRNKTTKTGPAWNRLGLLALLTLFGAATLATTACSSKTEEEILSEANAMMQEQNLLKATILYKEFLEKFPESDYRLGAQLGLAEAYYRNQEYELCREVLDEVIADQGGPASPSGFQPFLTKLRTFMDEERYAEALTLAEATSDSLSTAALPMKQAFQMFLGDLYARNQRLEDALLVFLDILENDAPTVEDELFQLELLRRAASIYEAQGQLDQVLVLFEDYIDDRPEANTLAQIHQMAGRVNQSLGNPEAADVHFDKAEEKLAASVEKAEKEQTKVSLMIGLANLDYIRGRSEKADDRLRKIIDEYPNSANRATALNLLARSKARTQDFETAMSLLQQVVTEYPNTQEAGQAIQQAQIIQAIRTSDMGTTATPTVATEEVLPLDDAPAAEAAEAAEEPETDSPSESPEAEATEAPAVDGETETETVSPVEP